MPHGNTKPESRPTAPHSAIPTWVYLLALVLAATLPAHANFPSVISGGGGRAESGSTVLQGTLGQPAATSASQGTTTLAAGFWHAIDVTTGPPSESFESWMNNLPPEQKPPPDQRGPLDTPAGDGVPNLLKYALGQLPLVPSGGAVQHTAVHEGKLALVLERSATAAVTLQTKGSEDLADWTNLTTTEEILDDLGDGRLRVRLLTNIDPDEASHYFLRIRFDTP